MKRLLCLLLGVLLLTGCSAEVPEEPTETEPRTKTVYVHSTLTYHRSGSITSRTEYVYNDENLLTDVIVSGKDGAQIQRYLVTCDENGNPTEWASAAGTTVNYTYDTQGRTLRTETYTGETLMTSTEYTWSGALRISTTVRTPSRENRLEYTYNENGALIRQDIYENGQLKSYGLYTAGEDGKPLCCFHYTPDGNAFSTVTYEYSEGKETRTTADAQGSVTAVNILTYDSHGNLLSDDTLDSSGNVLSSEVHEWIPIEVPVDTPRAGI